MKGKLKKILIALLIVVIIVALAFGGYFVVLKIQENNVLAKVDEVFNVIKSGNEEEIKKYIDLDDVENQSKNKSTKEATESVVDDEKMLKAITKNLNYEVISKDTKWNNCTLTLKVSNKDFKTVLSGYMSKAITLAFSSAFSDDKDAEEKMEKELETYFQEQYNSDSVPTISNEITLNVKKEKGEWKVNYEKASLLNAIMPGFSEIKKSLESLSSRQ